MTGRYEIELEPSIADCFGTLLQIIYDKDSIRYIWEKPKDEDEINLTAVTPSKIPVLLQASDFLGIPRVYDWFLKEMFDLSVEEEYYDYIYDCFFPQDVPDSVFAMATAQLSSTEQHNLFCVVGGNG